MEQFKKILFVAICCCLLCALASCAASQPDTSRLIEEPRQTTAPMVTTTPLATTVPTKPVNTPFDPTALAVQIPETVKEEMKQAYVAQFFPNETTALESVCIERVFGIFGETIVLFVDGLEYACVATFETVNGVDFCYGDAQPLEVYFEGHYYDLQEAFDSLIISAEDLLVIAENYYSVYPRS